MNRLNVQESEDKHVRSIALKVVKHKNKQESSDESDEENLSFLSRKFSKFLKGTATKTPRKKGMETKNPMILIPITILVLVAVSKGT